jgi:hypothetical protein
MGKEEQELEARLTESGFEQPRRLAQLAVGEGLKGLEAQIDW